LAIAIWIDDIPSRFEFPHALRGNSEERLATIALSSKLIKLNQIGAGLHPDAQRLSSPGGDRRRRRLLTLRCNWMFK